MPDDLCGYGRAPASEARALACDYSGLFPAHPAIGCQTYANPAFAAVESVSQLRAMWQVLEKRHEVDAMGGAEYHHALAHLRHKLASRIPAPALMRRAAAHMREHHRPGHPRHWFWYSLAELLEHEGGRRAKYRAAGTRGAPASGGPDDRTRLLLKVARDYLDSVQ